MNFFCDLYSLKNLTWIGKWLLSLYFSMSIYFLSCCFWTITITYLPIFMGELDRCLNEIVASRVLCSFGFQLWKSLKWCYTKFKSGKVAKLFRTKTITKKKELWISTFCRSLKCYFMLVTHALWIKKLILNKVTKCS